ncbi:AMSH-like ubiquitin thioesterase 2 [Tripterygium wilfordii]|uniref:AMSH-like ubiquitin thioesterase 2 n=1 Tax=Tripterygium wilfordii TaxID=458696 RepID=A0A7J7DJR5_TRIWF|nr:AMSH-like ubiquitin thioesterase 2 isoform X2 [Tripterygium wilfordii]KAF5746602.1 AMSH-like ubiquitin thioesterase 2 [Tripterygium wilfordii]
MSITDPCFRIIKEEESGLASFYPWDSTTSISSRESVCTTFVESQGKCQHVSVHSVTLSSPSPVLSCVQKEARNSHISHISVADSDTQSCNEPTALKVLQDVHISARLMEDFLELARENTEKDLETCGTLGAKLEEGTFYVTTLIVPKQESSSNSCQAMNDEEVFAIQNERSLSPVGWIHTHPSQSCFLSSIDLHTQYSYQVMVPEAFAIVMAPTDTSRTYGIFRLTDPGGMCVLKECQERGFYPHKEPEDGTPMYEQCSNVYKNSNLRFEIFDLR